MSCLFAPVTLGRRVRGRDFGWFGIIDAAHRPCLRLKPHAHLYPAITMVRSGCFGLETGGTTYECSRTGVFFKLGDEIHSNRISPNGARSLIVELRIDHPTASADRELTLPPASMWSTNPRTLRLADEIDREFHSPDSASPLAVEGLVLELLAWFLRDSRSVTSQTPPPRWLKRAHEIIHERFGERLGWNEIAAELGLHPGHLARVFRKYFHCSVGEYVRRLRLDRATEQLRLTDKPLADIAIEAGFYDQAHFSRWFKRRAGVTPGRYRAAMFNSKGISYGPARGE